MVVESYVTGNDVHTMSSNSQSSYGAINQEQYESEPEVSNSSPQSIRALASSLDNPAVQAALDNLLASGPSLLQSLSAVSSQSQKAPAPSSSGLASLSMAYDRASPPPADVRAGSMARPTLHQSTSNGPRARGPGPVRAPMAGAPRPGSGLRPSQPLLQQQVIRPQQQQQATRPQQQQQQQQRPTQHMTPNRPPLARPPNARPTMW